MKTKKLFFAAMSLVALTACTDNDFESQKIAEQSGTVSPIKFEVVNDGGTRASLDRNTIAWTTEDDDLFTLYHGAALGEVTGYENATYKATAVEGAPATLTTPSMIKAGAAIMVWPVDTMFRIGSGDALSLVIPADQGGLDKNGNETIQNQIPYVSDQFEIGAYKLYNEDDITTTTNAAGKDRKYPVYMRPMASQLNLNADYAGTDDEIATLYKGGSEGLSDDEAIDEIKVTSVALITKDGGTTPFTTEIGVKFTDPTQAQTDRWLAKSPNNAWKRITSFDEEATETAYTLTTKCLTGNSSSKFLLLKQPVIEQGVDEGAVVVNTIYGKVIVAKAGVANTKYEEGEWEDAWYRYIKGTTQEEAYEEKADVPETSGEYEGKYKTTSAPADGMMQTINAFSAFVGPEGSTVEGEPMGSYAPRFVKVLLTHLDMSDLHIKDDKQLRDAARVWEKMVLDPVTVYLDGDKNGEFKISQKTIETINEINGNTLGFKVQPCQKDGEACGTIVITGGDEIQDIAFIKQNEEAQFAADVVLNEGETWKWVDDVKVGEEDVKAIVNRGTMVNAEAATLRTLEFDGTQNNVPFINDATGVWNISGGRVTVEFMVYRNIGEVNIARGAQYIQERSYFINWGETLPERFIDGEEIIGVVNNEGVFATLNEGTIKNWGGLIEHKDKDAKTYITENQTRGADFSNGFGISTLNENINKMGTINLPWGNKDEDNISISAELAEGFVSVTIDGEVTGTLQNDQLGDKVNYVRILSGVTEIGTLAQVSYLEVDTDHEIAWTVGGETTFDGLIVLSDLNVKLNTTVNVSKATYLDADMYVGGNTNITAAKCNGYFGNTTAKFATNYIDYGRQNN